MSFWPSSLTEIVFKKVPFLFISVFRKLKEDAVALWYVGALDPGLAGVIIRLCSWARHFTLTVPLFTQEYKWVPANCQGNLTKCWRVTCDGLASHPGGVAILLVASCYRNWDKLKQLCEPGFFFSQIKTTSSRMQGQFRRRNLLLTLLTKHDGLSPSSADVIR